MVDITASTVKELRDATNVSMMECKRALQESEGDMQKATRLLREKGIAVAAKKSARVANQGLIVSLIKDNGKTGSLVEVNCETDFVARNSDFQAFAAELAEKAIHTDNALAEEAKDNIIARIAKIGENIVVRRNIRYTVQNSGMVASYIHLGGKVGVLLELGCEKDETTQKDVFKELAKDLTLHIAACNPKYIVSQDIPADEIKAEREIYAKQVENKPPQIIDKIVDGKMHKFYAQVCIMDQEFVKEQKLSVKNLLSSKEKELDDKLSIRRFTRYQVGE